MTSHRDAGSDLELAQALAAREPKALEVLYHRYAALAYLSALRVLGDPASAEEVVQDCFVKLWTGAYRFDARRGSLRGWLLAIVRNQSIDYLRGRRGRERHERELPSQTPATGPGSDPWREVADLVRRSALRDALASLPPEQRQTVELVYLRGYRQPEIAKMIGVPLSTVKGRLRLGVAKLQSYLQARGLLDYVDDHE